MSRIGARLVVDLHGGRRPKPAAADPRRGGGSFEIASPMVEPASRGRLALRQDHFVQSEDE